MFQNVRFTLIAILALGCFELLGGSAMANDAIAPDAQQDIVDEITDLLSKNYIYPDKAEGMGRHLTTALDEFREKSDKTPDAFATFLSQTLVEKSGDLHFSVGIDPTWIEQMNSGDTGGQTEADRLQGERNNHGLKDVRILRGNVGYIRFDYFADPEVAAPTLDAAMRATQHTDALIFDVRYNNGGVLEMAQLLMSYLFSSDEPIILFDYEYGDEGTVVKRGQWVLPSVAGNRRLQTPVFVLTSNTSFSSAEWFSSVLQSYGRATIVGGRTAGGAHPVIRKPIDNKFFLQMPFGKIRNPVTKGDFEGSGIQPDVEVPSARALSEAHAMALDTLVDSNYLKPSERLWLEGLNQAEYSPLSLTDAQLTKAVGTYEGRKIFLENGTLFYTWRDRFTLSLTPLSNTVFLVEGTESYRLRLVQNERGTLDLQRQYRDGATHIYRRLEN